MKYDFTTVYDRRGMDALAVDALGQPGGFAPDKPKDGFSVIPMWVADMNFATVPMIPAAIIERAQHPLYGYFATPDACHQAITDWCAAHEKTLEDVLHAGWDVGVAWQDGRMFHHPCAIRMNLALPRALVEEAFNRLSAYVFV